MRKRDSIKMLENLYKSHKLISEKSMNKFLKNFGIKFIIEFLLTKIFTSAIFKNEKEKIKYEGNCSICLNNFEPKDKIFITACEHIYHHECMVNYLNLIEKELKGIKEIENFHNRFRCPNCKEYFFTNKNYQKKLDNNKNNILNKYKINFEPLNENHISKKSASSKNQPKIEIICVRNNNCHNNNHHYQGRRKKYKKNIDGDKKDECIDNIIFDNNNINNNNQNYFYGGGASNSTKVLPLMNSSESFGYQHQKINNYLYNIEGSSPNIIRIKTKLNKFNNHTKNNNNKFDKETSKSILHQKKIQKKKSIDDNTFDIKNIDEIDINNNDIVNVDKINEIM